LSTVKRISDFFVVRLLAGRMLSTVSRTGVGMPRTLRAIGLPRARRAAGRMLSTVPRAAGVETPGAIGLPPPGRTATFLRARFACTDEEVLRAERKLLPHQVHPGIDPARAGNTCDSLQSRLSLSEPELKKVVLGLPSVLSCSYEANIAPSLAALQSRLSLSEPELKKVVLRLPQVLGYSYEANIAPSLAALQSRLSLSELELKKVVLGLPPVLSYSYEANIAPTLAFMETAFHLAPDELRERVVAIPPLLGYSLEVRYHPRVTLVSALGVVVTQQTLTPAAMYTDAKFMAWLRKREQLGLTDEEWAALCFLPLVERGGGIPPVFTCIPACVSPWP